MSNTHSGCIISISATLVAIMSLGFADIASAQLNDNLANAEVILFVPYADTVSNGGAGSEANEVAASCGNDGGKSVWWSYTPLSSGPVAVSTRGSTFDTILSVYVDDGFGHPLSELACNDDVDSIIQAELSFDAVFGVAYVFRITGFNADSGTALISVTRPTPDDLAGAKFVFGLPFSDNQDNVTATPEVDEVSASCGVDFPNSVWWRFTPWFSGTLIVDTDNSDFDTILSVFTGAIHPLTETICDDNGGTVTGRSMVSFPVVNGTTYYFRVTGSAGASGTVGFGVRAAPGEILSEAIPVLSLPFADTLSNAGAGLSSDEVQASCGIGSASVWWSSTPSVTGPLIINTNGSNFDTILSVHTGGNHPLSETVCDDDSGNPAPQSRVTFTATQGTTYYIRVVGPSAATGTVILNVKIPTPDDIFGAKTVSGVPFTDTLSNTGAGSEPGELLASCQTNGTNSIWWRFSPSFSGTVIADTDSTGFDTILSVYTGTSHPLNEIACDDDGGAPTTQSELSFVASPFETYYIRVAGFNGESGQVRLHLTKLPGDDLADAIPVTGLPFTDTLSNAGTGLEVVESTASCGVEVGKSVWWKLTAHYSDTLTVNTDSSGFDTILSIHTGSSHPLAEIECDDFGGAPGGRSKLSFTAVKDSTYFIRVSGSGLTEGTVVLAIDPASVAFSGAVLLEGAYLSGGLMGVSPGFQTARPTHQPYSDPEYFASFLEYFGPDSVVVFPPNTIDWMLASLRFDISAASEIPSSEQAVLVLDDGSIVNVNGDSVRFQAPPDGYFVVLRHRNHISVMSFAPIDFTSGRGSWDSTLPGSAFSNTGPPMKDFGGGFFGMFAGDGDHDGQITVSDFNLWLAATKAVQVGYQQADYDLDAQSTASDFNKWLTNTKAVAASQVPE